jgi:hypothetical protein
VERCDCNQEYVAVSCTPCNKTLWRQLRWAEQGNGSLKPESRYFDCIRVFKSLGDVPCCADKHGAL